MRSEDDENTKQAIERIEGMGLPAVVLRSPNCFEKPALDLMYKEIELLGEVFGKKDRAKEIIKLWEENVQFVKSRTQAIEDQDKVKVLFLGLDKKSREKGGAATVKGLEDAESNLVETIVNAKNAYRGSGASNVMSAEQILALDPDVILLPTWSGYHPPRELCEGKPFRNLQDLKAIKEKRVYALPWTPCNCCIRLEHLVNLMVAAKAVYPEKFADLKVHEWVLDFYKKLYGVDDEMAKKLRSAQWLDWTAEQDF
ncbi:MAG: ABC transporter substrate-binding protein [Armatimonadetes bacterium]|nr:ABC transporter substrate-binding protein [Armatimonadota bacterium]